jgi:CHAT domain-containing protein
VLDNRLEILVITANAPPLRRTVPNVDRRKLNQAIAALGSALTTPTTDPKPSAQALYRMVIAPIEDDLKQANINTLVYSPDLRLRSIPLGALHDGEKWLVERFQITYITASSTSDLTTVRDEQPKILAGTISEDRQKIYTVTFPSHQYPFQGLPAGKPEIKGIQSVIPTTTVLFEQDFTNDQIRDRVSQYNILHFATHGFFELDQPDQSFILLGAPDSKGKNYATLRDVHSIWKLSGIDLVTLSACETGVVAEKSDDKLGIMGLGWQFESAGARAVIASLWNVNDASTSLLMQQFYKNLATGKMTKSEALRQAQLSLLNKQITAKNALTKREAGVEVIATGTRSLPPPPDFSHPYYWAPFILIGNGL